MSGHIDHVREACELLRNTPVPERAQVHATLALVEAVREIGALLATVETAAVVDDDALVTYDGTVIRPGDPDPTPEYPEGGFCGARMPGGGSQMCTWQEGHEGAHVAGNEKIAVEVWS